MEARPVSLDHLHLPHFNDLPPSAHRSATQSLWPNHPKIASAQDTGSPFVKAAPGTRPDDKSTVTVKHDEDADMSYHPDADEPGLEGLAGRSPEAFSGPVSSVPLPLPSSTTTQTNNNPPRNKNIGPDQRRPHGISPPPLAPNLRFGLRAGFSPWTGNSAEDLLSESVVRTGFTDKSVVSGQSESNNARPAIWPSLKNKNGLPLLSTLFVSIMDKRQARGKCTAASTFKPPPRVTLTDTRREAWLKDLSSLNVPLRKLSRTIPHGIRGRILLDQCLGKKVPLARAVWLVKCVGANEIRAFRRKGISGPIAQSGEAKWIKDWTTCVEQFVESIIASCGQSTWRANMQYTIRLVSAIFADDLLDRHDFLDWLISSFSSSTPDVIPIWTLLLGIFRSHLIATRARSHTLILALASQKRNLQDKPAFQSPCLALDRLLMSALREQPAALLASRDWALVESALQSLQCQEKTPRDIQTIESICKRNDGLNISAARIRNRMKPVRLLLFEHLDSVRLESSDLDVVRSCIDICPDHHLLVEALVDWATTKYRTGYTRLYLTARILRALYGSTRGLDFEQAVLQVLTRSGDRQHHLFSKLVLELVRSGHFNFGKYLQWIIATGAAASKDSPCCSLLLSISPDHLSPQSKSLRAAIFSRLHLTQTPAAELDTIKDQLRLITETGTDDRLAQSRLLANISSLSPAAQTQLCDWIVGECENNTGLSASIFRTVRSILERTADFSALGQILQCLISSASTEILADLAATVESNLAILSSMGTLAQLTKGLIRRYVDQKQMGHFDPGFQKALASVCAKQQTFALQSADIKAELLTHEQLQAAVVCSPASDSVMNVQLGTINSDADIDRILSSGNIMDEQVLTRLFSAIVERTVKWTVSGTVALTNSTRWFALLKVFDASSFDRHMNNLVNKLTGNAGTDQVRAVLMALVSSGCLRIDQAFDAFVKKLDALEAASAPQLARFSFGCLQTFLPTADLDFQCHEPEIYRFQIQQRDICQARRADVLRFFYNGLTAPAEVAAFAFSTSSIDWLADCCTRYWQDFSDGLRLQDGNKIQQNLHRLVHAMEQRTDDTGSAASIDSVDDLVSSTNELRLPFIRLALISKAYIQETGDPTLALRLAFDRAIGSQSHLWSQLLEGTGDELNGSLYQSSCSNVLQVIQAVNPNQNSNVDADLQVAAITAQGCSETTLGLVDQCSDALSLLTTRTQDLSLMTTNGSDASMDVRLKATTLLRLAIINVSALEPDKASNGAVQRLLSRACQFLTAESIQCRPDVVDLAYDACGLFARWMSADEQASIYRRLPESTRQDARIKFLLGIEDGSTKWLALASRAPVPPPLASSAAAPTSSPTTAQAPGFRQGQSAATQNARGANDGVTATLAPPSPSSSTQTGAGPLPTPRAVGGHQLDVKYQPFLKRPWEMMQDPTPNMGENDTSLSLQLFAARKVL